MKTKRIGTILAFILFSGVLCQQVSCGSGSPSPPIHEVPVPPDPPPVPEPEPEPPPVPEPEPEPEPVSTWPEYNSNPYEIRISKSLDARMGGIIAYDIIDNNGLMDFVVTTDNYIAVYAHYGRQVWERRDNIRVTEAANRGEGYPGLHAPGVALRPADELIYLTNNGQIKVTNSQTGALKRTFNFGGAQSIAIGNLEGRGNDSLVIQFDQKRLRAINVTTGRTLWSTNEWLGIEHSQVRLVDLDNDGLDEVVGVYVLDNNGRLVNKRVTNFFNIALGSMDSFSFGPILDNGDIQFVIAEQGGGLRTILLDKTRAIAGFASPSIPNDSSCGRERDPDKLSVGEFDLNSPGLEIIARSACGLFPWVLSSNGELISTWSVADNAPNGWSESGIDVMSSIRWVGDRDYIAVKERHKDGKVAIINPITGRFIKVFNTKATRLYTVDVAGDFREEVVVVESQPYPRIRIFFNEGPNDEVLESFWNTPYYSDIHQVWNYYSPD